MLDGIRADAGVFVELEQDGEVDMANSSESNLENLNSVSLLLVLQLRIFDPKKGKGTKGAIFFFASMVCFDRQ